MNLLIVDDHAGMRSLIRDLISESMRSGIQIRECASGEEAVELCKAYTPDFITMDLRMGAMDGLTAVRLIRESHPDTHIAVVTQHDHAALRELARQAGADAYIPKDDLFALRRHFDLLLTCNDSPDEHGPN